MSKRIVVAASGASVAAAAILILRNRARMTQPEPRDERTRWRVVTISRPRADLDELPAPLAALGPYVETELRDAPGDRGTELRARLLPGGTHTPDDLRVALRHSKQLLEAGEVAVVHPTPHGRRRMTPQGIALDVIAAVSEGKGVL